MKTKVFVLLLGLLAGNAIAAETLASRVDALVKPYIDFRVFNGVIFAARGDKVLFAKAYGMANFWVGPEALPHRSETV